MRSSYHTLDISYPFLQRLRRARIIKLLVCQVAILSLLGSRFSIIRDLWQGPTNFGTVRAAGGSVSFFLVPLIAGIRGAMQAYWIQRLLFPTATPATKVFARYHNERSWMVRPRMARRS